MLGNEIEEKFPSGVLPKLKYFIKRYWIVALPVHGICSIAWASAIYSVIISGLNVIAILEYCHVPASLVTKIRNTPASASAIVATLLIYKLLTPIRYLFSCWALQHTLRMLRKYGMIHRVRDIEQWISSKWQILIQTATQPIKWFTMKMGSKSERLITNEGVTQP
ncbi:protein play a role in the structure and strength of muscle [Ditylenchus destructor]|nr:protein play a role in the structure and strength of muscle [Ditylenchus destructor]